MSRNSINLGMDFGDYFWDFIEEENKVRVFIVVIGKFFFLIFYSFLVYCFYKGTVFNRDESIEWRVEFCRS